MLLDPDGTCPRCAEYNARPFYDGPIVGPDDAFDVTEEAAAPSSWRPKDLAPVLDGAWLPPRPVVGRRDDGAGLFYPGRQHAIAAESEAGKTWLALDAAAAEIARGNCVIHLDFEDDEGAVTGRLLAMGVSRELILARFIYISPEDPMDTAARAELDHALARRPTLAVIDGITEAMSLHGMELKDNTDVARFGRMLPRYIARRGPAVVSLDHVTKDRETRNGHAIGGIHKLNGINGAMYLLDSKSPFGIGLAGRSRLYIRKDRPGQLRRNGQPSHDGLFWYADLVVDSHDEMFAEVSLEPPAEHAPGQVKPTVIMAKICKQLDGLTDGLSKNAIETAVGGKRDYTRLALELLVNEGYVKAERHGQAVKHTLVKMYAE